MHLVTDLNDFVNLIDKTSFDFDMTGIISEVSNLFPYVGYLKEVKISNSKLESLLQKHSSTFEILADEHLKKINYYKKASLQNNKK